MSTIKDKVVVITGSTRGFGYAIAESMLEAGAVVAVTGRSQKAVDGTLASLQLKGRVSGFVMDVRDEEQVYKLVDDVIKEFGHIDIWVNNAGYSNAAGMMLDMDPKEALDMFLSNDLGVFYCTQAIMRYMLPRKQGHADQHLRQWKFPAPRITHWTLWRNESVADILHAQSCKRAQRQRRANFGIQPGHVVDRYAHESRCGRRARQGNVEELRFRFALSWQTRQIRRRQIGKNNCQQSQGIYRS